MEGPDTIENISAPTKPSIPKRHHYIPQFVLKNFANEDEQIFFLDKRNIAGGVKLTSIKNVFVEQHLNSTIESDGSRNPQLEIDIAEFETRADRITKKIVINVRSGRNPSLTTDEKQFWDSFFVLQFKRTPEITSKITSQDELDQELDKAVSEFERDKRPLTSEERLLLDDPFTRKRMLKNARISTLRQPPLKAISHLNARGLAIAKIANPRKSFVMGSNPLIRLDRTASPHIAEHTTEFWFPIAHDIAISPGFEIGSEKIFWIDDRATRKLNRIIVKQSTSVASRSKELLESLFFELTLSKYK